MRARPAAEIREILAGIENVGRLSDGLVGFGRGPFRIGLDPLLNLIPALGALYTSATGLYLLVQAWRASVPVPTLVAMWACMAADGMIGSIPVLGAVGDFVWRGQAMAARLAADAIRRTHGVEGFAGRVHEPSPFDALRTAFGRMFAGRA